MNDDSNQNSDGDGNQQSTKLTVNAKVNNTADQSLDEDALIRRSVAAALEAFASLQAR